MGCRALTGTKVVLDACVLVGSIRRHVLLSFAEAGAFSPVWSADILFETERAIPKGLPAGAQSDRDVAAHAHRICALMNAAFPMADQRFTAGPSLKGVPDPDDQHVIDLAVSSGSAFIITENLRDFPKGLLNEFGLSAMKTDDFLRDMIFENLNEANRIIDRLRQRIGRAHIGREEMIARMKKVGLRKSARVLAE